MNFGLNPLRFAIIFNASAITRTTIHAKHTNLKISATSLLSDNANLYRKLSADILLTDKRIKVVINITADIDIPKK